MMKKHWGGFCSRLRKPLRNPYGRQQLARVSVGEDKSRQPKKDYSNKYDASTLEDILLVLS